MSEATATPMLSLPVRWNVMRDAIWSGTDPAASAPTSPSASELKETAHAYLVEYAAARWDGMAKLMAEDFELVDHGSPRHAPTPLRSNRTQALERLRQFGDQNGITGLELEFTDMFCSGNVMLFLGRVNARGLLPGGALGYAWRTRYVSMITVRSGLVTRHEEFCDCVNPELSRLPTLAR